MNSYCKWEMNLCSVHHHPLNTLSLTQIEVIVNNTKCVEVSFTPTSVIYLGSGFLEERLMYIQNKLFVKQAKSFCLLLD